MDENEPACLVGKVKTQTIRQIFKDLSPKNLNGVEFFFLICAGERMELQFMSTPKDILITILLKRELFASYLYNKEKPSLHKYTLDDFAPIPMMFENNKHILDLLVDEARFMLTYTGGLGMTQFVGQSLNCDEDDEEYVISEEDLRPQEEQVHFMELKFSRVGVFECIMRYAKAVKLTSLWLRYDSVSHRLEVADRQENEEIRWLLRVEEVGRNTLNSQQEFHFKSFSCAMNLLPNDSPLKLTFYPKFMLIEVLEREKTFFTIRLNAKTEVAN